MEEEGKNVGKSWNVFALVWGKKFCCCFVTTMWITFFNVTIIQAIIETREELCVEFFVYFVFPLVEHKYHVGFSRVVFLILRRLFDNVFDVREINQPMGITLRALIKFLNFKLFTFAIASNSDEIGRALIIIFDVLRKKLEKKKVTITRCQIYNALTAHDAWWNFITSTTIWMVFLQQQPI